MKTEIKIPVRAYAVQIKDERSGEKKNDVIVIEKAKLQAGAMVGLGDDDIICRIYNRQGYRVLEIAPPEKLELSVDLHELYQKQRRMARLMQFGLEHKENNTSD